MDRPSNAAVDHRGRNRHRRLVVHFQNTGIGDFHFLFFDIKATKWLWILDVFAAGFATCSLWTRYRAATRAKA
jgi:hypothetical protein